MNTSKRGFASLVLAILVIHYAIPSFLNWPLELFLTFIHEAGHATAALLTGGQVHGIVVSPNGAGVTTSSGGWRLLTVPAGYLGTVLFGALVLRLNRQKKLRPWLLRGIAASILGLTLFYSASPFTAGLGVAAAAVLFAVSWALPPVPEYHFVNLLGMYVGLGSLRALEGLWRIENGAKSLAVEGFSHVGTDARAWAAMTWNAPRFWVLVWVLLALWILGREVLKTAES